MEKMCARAIKLILYQRIEMLYTGSLLIGQHCGRHEAVLHEQGQQIRKFGQNRLHYGRGTYYRAASEIGRRVQITYVIIWLNHQQRILLYLHITKIQPQAALSLHAEHYGHGIEAYRRHIIDVGRTHGVDGQDLTVGRAIERARHFTECHRVVNLNINRRHTYQRKDDISVTRPVLCTRSPRES